MPFRARGAPTTLVGCGSLEPFPSWPGGFRGGELTRALIFRRGPPIGRAYPRRTSAGCSRALSSAGRVGDFFACTGFPSAPSPLPPPRCVFLERGNGLHPSRYPFPSSAPHYPSVTITFLFYRQSRYFRRSSFRVRSARDFEGSALVPPSPQPLGAFSVPQRFLVAGSHGPGGSGVLLSPGIVRGLAP